MPHSHLLYVLKAQTRVQARKLRSFCSCIHWSTLGDDVVHTCCLWAHFAIRLCDAQCTVAPLQQGICLQSCHPDTQLAMHAMQSACRAHTRQP
jgi:hypothetical protein